MFFFFWLVGMVSKIARYGACKSVVYTKEYSGLWARIFANEDKVCELRFVNLYVPLRVHVITLKKCLMIVLVVSFSL